MERKIRIDGKYEREKNNNKGEKKRDLGNMRKNERESEREKEEIMILSENYRESKRDERRNGECKRKRELENERNGRG